MKKKQLLSGVMALLLSASLCACGGSKTAEGTSEAAGESSEAETSNTLSEGTPVPGGSVVYGMTQDLASLESLLPMADLFRLLPAITSFPMMQRLTLSH